MRDSTERFSNRVADYIRYRPSYPASVLDLLEQDCGLNGECEVADIGSGTGILTRLLLERAAKVYAVEPNQPMREAAEAQLADHKGFISIKGRAASTGLPEAGVDLITAGQSFHWFANDEAVQEFFRILKPGGWLALIWNERLTRESDFLCAYEALLNRYTTDYPVVNHAQFDLEALDALFAPHVVHHQAFDYAQLFDFEGLKGRLRSCSYCPEETHETYAPLMQELEILHTSHAVDGKVSFAYKTQVYSINLTPQ